MLDRQCRRFDSGTTRFMPRTWRAAHGALSTTYRLGGEAVKRALSCELLKLCSEFNDRLLVQSLGQLGMRIAAPNQDRLKTIRHIGFKLSTLYQNVFELPPC